MIIVKLFYFFTLNNIDVSSLKIGIVPEHAGAN
jgi:hypothetical protein